MDENHNNSKYDEIISYYEKGEEIRMKNMTTKWYMMCLCYMLRLLIFLLYILPFLTTAAAAVSFMYTYNFKEHLSSLLSFSFFLFFLLLTVSYNNVHTHKNFLWVSFSFYSYLLHIHSASFSLLSHLFSYIFLRIKLDYLPIVQDMGNLM